MAVIDVTWVDIELMSCADFRVTERDGLFTIELDDALVYVDSTDMRKIAKAVMALAQVKGWTQEG